jgi:hypothetical protein
VRFQLAATGQRRRGASRFRRGKLALVQERHRNMPEKQEREHRNLYAHRDVSDRIRKGRPVPFLSR